MLPLTPRGVSASSFPYLQGRQPDPAVAVGAVKWLEPGLLALISSSEATEHKQKVCDQEGSWTGKKIQPCQVPDIRSVLGCVQTSYTFRPAHKSALNIWVVGTCTPHITAVLSEGL